MTQLRGQIAFVTGAGTGIGLACVEDLARKGAVVVAGVLDGQQDAISASTACKVLDVTDEARWIEVVDEIEAEYGGLDVLVNNAGVHLEADAAETTREAWNRVMQVNLYGTFLGCRTALPALRRRGGGAIVNIASFAAHRGVRRQVAYATSKGGILAMTCALAADHVGDGIRVNCVCPAATDTPIIQRFADSQSSRREFLDRLADLSPMGRIAQPEEVASVVSFLASRDASYITGAAIPIDGGRSS